MSASVTKRRAIVRRGPRRLKPRPTPATGPDYPYTMRLKDGSTLFVLVPGKWMSVDRDGSPLFGPDAIRFLDKIQALAMSATSRPPTPGYLATLRVALGLTQREFAERLDVDKITVSRWERGETTPGKEALQAIDRVRREATRKGVVLPS